jgi:two-component system, response regulator PdtaR
MNDHYQKQTGMTGAAPGSRIPDHPSRILVADDEHLVAAEITGQLAEIGYTIVGPVGTAADAVRLARTALPDLALLDIRMPNGDGLSAAGVILGELGIPVVILSAHADHEYVNIAEERGVFGYLIKPVEPNQLRAAIQVAWGRFRKFASEHADLLRLERRLEERPVIERAKWILVSRAGVDEPEAMRMLQQKARSSRDCIVNVAERVIRAGEGANGSPVAGPTEKAGAIPQQAGGPPDAPGADRG